MYERFTERACKVMELAQSDAKRRGHAYVGTEHILLGLIAEGSGVGALALQRLGIEADRVRGEIEKIICSGPDRVTRKHLPQTPRAKRVIVLALEASREARLPYIGTEHLLLGLAGEQEGVAAQVLQNLGATEEGVRRAIERATEECAAKPEFENRLREYERRQLGQGVWSEPKWWLIILLSITAVLAFLAYFVSHAQESMTRE
jgi:ATP-dependent Clp protease ATP-binding subunit ClpA